MNRKRVLESLLLFMDVDIATSRPLVTASVNSRHSACQRAACAALYESASGTRCLTFMSFEIALGTCQSHRVEGPAADRQPSASAR